MAKQRNAVRAGIFMVASVALTIFVIIAISGAGRFTQSFTVYTVAFGLRDNVAGLRPGDEVRIGGMRVGAVRDIQLRQAPPLAAGDTTIVVSIDVPSHYTLHKNAVVRVDKPLTGAAAINVEDLGSGTVAAASDMLAGKPDALSSFEAELGQVAPSLPPIVENVKAASGSLRTDLDKFGGTADHATAAVDAVKDWLGPSTGDFHSTVANLSSVTGTLKDRLPGLTEQVSGVLKDIDTDITKAGTAIADIQTTVANTKDITASARSVISGNKSKLDGMIDSLKTTSDNLKFASMEIRHSPWRLLYQPKEGEVANLNIYDSVREFSEGAARLNDAAGALRDAMADKNAKPDDLKKLLVQLDESFAHFQQVQQKLWNEVKE